MARDQLPRPRIIASFNRDVDRSVAGIKRTRSQKVHAASQAQREARMISARNSTVQGSGRRTVNRRKNIGSTRRPTSSSRASRSGWDDEGTETGAGDLSAMIRRPDRQWRGFAPRSRRWSGRPTARSRPPRLHALLAVLLELLRAGVRTRPERLARSLVRDGTAISSDSPALLGSRRRRDDPSRDRRHLAIPLPAPTTTRLPTDQMPSMARRSDRQRASGPGSAP